MKLDEERVRELVERTNLLVEAVDAEHRNEIFPIIFRYLLGEEPSQGSKRQPQPEPTSLPEDVPRTVMNEGFNKMLTSQFEWSKYSYIHNLEPYTQYLLILKIALEDFGVDGLTPTEVAKIMLEKFRIPKKYNAISMALGSLRSKHVDRIPKGTGYAYRISKAGLDSVQAGIENLKAKELKGS